MTRAPGPQWPRRSINFDTSRVRLAEGTVPGVESVSLHLLGTASPPQQPGPGQAGAYERERVRLRHCGRRGHRQRCDSLAARERHGRQCISSSSADRPGEEIRDARRRRFGRGPVRRRLAIEPRRSKRKYGFVRRRFPVPIQRSQGGVGRNTVGAAGRCSPRAPAAEEQGPELFLVQRPKLGRVERRSLRVQLDRASSC